MRYLTSTWPSCLVHGVPLGLVLTTVGRITLQHYRCPVCRSVARAEHD